MCSLRRSIQSQADFSFFSLDESGCPSAVNNTFLSFHFRDKKCGMKKTAVPSILIAVMLLAVAVIAGAQQPVKVPPDRRSNFCFAFHCVAAH